MKSCEVKFWLHNIVHFSHLKALDVIYPECIHEYSRSILLLCKEFGKWFQDFRIMEQEFLLFALPLNADMEKDPERLQIEFINLQCYSILTRKCLKETGKILISTYTNKTFLCSDNLSQEWLWCFSVIICGNSFLWMIIRFIWHMGTWVHILNVENQYIYNENNVSVNVGNTWRITLQEATFLPCTNEELTDVHHRLVDHHIPFQVIVQCLIIAKVPSWGHWSWAGKRKSCTRFAPHALTME
jgi:hypothetical protein